jgi:hypothetical protein
MWISQTMMLLMLGLLREVVDREEEVDEMLLDHVETFSSSS